MSGWYVLWIATKIVYLFWSEAVSLNSYKTWQNSQVTLMIINSFNQFWSLWNSFEHMTILWLIRRSHDYRKFKQGNYTIMIKASIYFKKGRICWILICLIPLRLIFRVRLLDERIQSRAKRLGTYFQKWKACTWSFLLNGKLMWDNTDNWGAGLGVGG